MTRTYTAADFANAQFAKHPDGRLAHRVEYGTVFSWSFERNDVNDYAADEYMAEYCWVPVIPARTIHDSDVEALCTDTASYERDDYLDGFIRGFQQAGGVILDDPEPTNTEKWHRLLDAYDEDTENTNESFPEWADRIGLTAPSVKGN